VTGGAPNLAEFLAGYDGGTVTAQPVPEPSTLALLLVGLAVLCGTGMVPGWRYLTVFRRTFREGNCADFSAL
jgi:hypothetical protein